METGAMQSDVICLPIPNQFVHSLPEGHPVQTKLTNATHVNVGAIKCNRGRRGAGKCVRNYVRRTSAVQDLKIIFGQVHDPACKFTSEILFPQK
jgi:hypothetical protein